VSTVIQTIQLGIPVARMEVIDETQLAIVNRYSKTSYPETPTLFFEFHGTSQGVVDDQARMVDEIAREQGALGFQWASTPEERARLWQARHDVYYATVASRPGALAMTTDVCVPISQLAPCILETQADARATGLAAPLVGHAGDGNFHLILMLDPASEEEVSRVSAFSQRLVERALRLGGTCSGEHGVGLGKMKYLEAEHGEALAVMRALKQALDPHDLMNPGKMLPPG
jgi:D-lactate dehydrogenase (cytochrome)